MVFIKDQIFFAETASVNIDALQEGIFDLISTTILIFELAKHQYPKGTPFLERRGIGEK